MRWSSSANPSRALWLALTIIASSAPLHVSAAVDGCESPAVEKGGIRRLALLVGVGKYKNSSIRKLKGPPSDVAAFEEVLVQRYGFPRENICVLLDEKATTAAFVNAFEKALVGRARKGDVAVFYFSGHGSQMTDDGTDEPSGMDQSLLFHDARTGDVTDFRDDRLNDLLARLYERTTNLVVVSDSCHSGSMTRAAGTAIARMEPPAGQAAPASGVIPGSTRPWGPAHLPDLIVLTAAADGTSALEIDGHGVFTDGLVQALNAPAPPLTYAQLARRVPGLVAVRSPQVPFFQGRLDREVFGTAVVPRPIAWTVAKVSGAGAVVTLSGTPTPGMGKNAELRLYDRNAKREAYGDPSEAKALLVVEQPSALSPKARVRWVAENAKIQEGDLALLARPGDEAVQVSVRVRPEGEPGGLPKARAARLLAAIREDADAKAAVTPTEKAGDFELSQARDGRLRLHGVGDELRAEFEDEKDAVRVLWQLARQKALANLRGEGAPYFIDDESLRVEIVPAAPEEQDSDCGRRNLGEFAPRADGHPVQVLPLCVSFYVKVTLSKAAPRPVLVGGVMLSGDGRTFGFPMDGSTPEIKPGDAHTFDERFQARPPLGATDTLKIVGTLRRNPVEWYLLTSDWKKAPSTPPSLLHDALGKYLVAGARASPVVGTKRGEDSQWTVSTVTLKVEANPSFAQPASALDVPTAKEYTIPDFDIRPYLPDDTNSALYLVLEQASRLARQQVPYKQHAWTLPTFEENLKLGIDCSRAVMAAFTQAKLPYNDAGVYLTTADMVAPASRMADRFESCEGQPRQLGDLLVYRDEGDPQKGPSGHVVMVIDAQRRIAWGSHGWDGNAKALKVEPQTGVEFQQIKTSDDWKRWDRPNMREKACWRYRRFVEEAREGRGVPGPHALGEKPCSDSSCTAIRPASYTPTSTAKPAAP
jgi:hypothetical protein